MGASDSQPSFGCLQVDRYLDWFQEALHGFAAGGIYLLAGQPGIGKSTLAFQLAIARALLGLPTLYLLTEQSTEDAARRLAGIAATLDREVQPGQLQSLIKFDDSLSDIDQLSRSWVRGKRWAGSLDAVLELLILDSVQGHGLHGNSREYKLLLNFCRELKESSVTSVLISHITKDGNIAGPKTLEHSVDCVLVMRKAMSYRPLFVTKNRYGRTPDKAIPLILDKVTTALRPSPYKDSMVAVARAVIPGLRDIPEAQVNLRLPRALGQSGTIQSVGVPRKVIQQLISSIAPFVDPDLDELDLSIQCSVPGAIKYSQYIGLALSIAIVGSYIRRDVPINTFFIGEVDLLGNIRPISRDLIDETWDWRAREKWISLLQVPQGATIFCAAGCTEEIGRWAEGAVMVGSASVRDVVGHLWPDALLE